MKTISIADFKAAHNCSKVQIIRSPKTNKLFALLDERPAGHPDRVARVAGNWSAEGSTVVLVNDEGVECFINENANTLAEF